MTTGEPELVERSLTAILGAEIARPSRLEAREHLFLMALFSLSLLGQMCAIAIDARVEIHGAWLHYLPLHAGVEITGGIVAVAVALLLLNAERLQQGSSFNYPIAAGLLGMGLLDGLHGLMSEGNLLVWLHAAASFVGGAFFVLIWLPARWLGLVQKSLPLAAVSAAVLLGGYSLIFSEAVPICSTAGGFTLWFAVLKTSGSVFEILAAVKLYLAFKHSERRADLIFFYMSLQFGIVGLMFATGSAWDISWWSWHFLRLIGYGIALQFTFDVIKNYQRELEESVARRTMALNNRNKELAEINQKVESVSLRLSKYLSPQIYSSMFISHQLTDLVAKRKKLTIFFSDIADFTETTNRLESEELTGLLNDYLTDMAKIALDHGATIDKYIGDAVLAFFGDPESRGVRKDALAAVMMAIAMQRHMRELQHKWRNFGIEKPFQIRIAINTGFCTVGNFGSKDRMDYTVIGGEVNWAARLQSHAGLGGIIIGHETYALVRDEIPTEELAPVLVKGFADPVHCYRVLDLNDEGSAEDSVVRHRRPGAQIHIDIRRLSTDHRSETIKVMEELSNRLRDT
jgi:class 3 adenylate cyclase